ncbi:type II toxin-antitoxin system VapC family toxin [Candidatus Peregrinibacteria bacterium]|nr:type II toxin-antitoxin system VapC family toxin [Candidatus Peregrinibacteria bacterium]
MNIVDSSAWLEYFSGTKNAKNFRKAIHNTKKLIVPTIVIFEVFKKILEKTDRKTAIDKIGNMTQGKIVDIDTETSLLAVNISIRHRLPMADSLIAACGQKYNATIWTQDSDFSGLPGIKYFPKS